MCFLLRTLPIAITPEQHEHLRLWESPTDENRTAAEKYLRFLLSEQHDNL